MREIGIIILISILAGCDSQDTDDLRENLFDGVAFSATSDPRTPAVAVHENGEWMAVISSGTSSNVTGAMYTDRSARTFVVYINGNGLPELAYSQGHFFLFEHYREGKVDVAVINSSGDVTIWRGLEIDTSQLAEIAEKVPALATASLSQILQLGAIALSTAGCVAALIASSGIALPCGAAVIGISTALLASDESAIEASASAITIGAAAIGCAGQEPFACATLIAELAAGIASTFEEEREENEAILTSTEGALETGFGDVQVTLTWDEAVDLDLWVTDPFGERIYFVHDRSQSGGQLDRDDIDGYGPENTFWPRGQAPRGQYLVQVDHYSGGRSANFAVLIQAFGRVRSLLGNIRPDQTVTVTVFSDTELALVAKNGSCEKGRNLVSRYMK